MKDEFVERERTYCKDYAAFSTSEFLTQRASKESDQYKHKKVEHRLPFQRDRDRIIHTRAFRRLMHKTQIFNANKGDHYRNRLTHTLEVSQIARSIGKVLGLNDELIEAIALGHDVGHAPFGHVGERTLNNIISGQVEEFLFPKLAKGFKHNFQSVHLLKNLEKSTPDKYGINLTTAVLDGILKHTKTTYSVINENEDKEQQQVIYSRLPIEGRIYIDRPPITLEGQVVAVADEIAQVTHDLEDGLRAKIIDWEAIRENELVQKVRKDYELNFERIKEVVDARVYLIKHLVGFLINDVCVTSQKRIDKLSGEYPKFKDIEDTYKETIIDFSDGKNGTENIKRMQEDLANMIDESIISSQIISIADAKLNILL